MEGKFAVVIGVLAVIFLGIVVFLIITDQKLRRIEKDINKKL